jgi:hypothetical protein
MLNLMGESGGLQDLEGFSAVGEWNSAPQQYGAAAMPPGLTRVE